MSAAAWACAWATAQIGVDSRWRWAGKEGIALSVAALRPEDLLKILTLIVGHLPAEDQTVGRQMVEGMLAVGRAEEARAAVEIRCICSGCQIVAQKEH